MVNGNSKSITDRIAIVLGWLIAATLVVTVGISVLWAALEEGENKNNLQSILNGLMITLGVQGIIMIIIFSIKVVTGGA